jgi:hypothetical protein
VLVWQNNQGHRAVFAAKELRTRSTSVSVLEVWPDTTSNARRNGLCPVLREGNN